MALNPRTKRRVDRIKQEVDILTLLEGFGFRVRADMDREQQFQCSLHGDGRDTKPSARAYPESNSWYCWACQKSRDVVGTVREVQGMSFIDALKWLEKQYNLPPLPWLDGDRDYLTQKETVKDVVNEALTTDRSFEQDSNVLKGILEMVTEDRTLPRDRVLSYWDAFDYINYLVQGSQAKMPEPKGIAALQRVREKLLVEVKGD